MLTPEQLDRWVGALESGKYQQGRAQLAQGNSYCCLGVLCEAVLGLDMDEERPVYELGSAMDYPIGAMGGVSIAPLELEEAVPHEVRAELACRNDNGATFDEIAQLLRARSFDVVESDA